MANRASRAALAAVARPKRRKEAGPPPRPSTAWNRTQAAASCIAVPSVASGSWLTVAEGGPECVGPGRGPAEDAAGHGDRLRQGQQDQSGQGQARDGGQAAPSIRPP